MSKSYTQQEVKERAQRILNMTPFMRSGTINEFHNMAAGESEHGIREKYYPGKPDSFFREVLQEVERGEK
jgi:hypothetical protein